jgi:hypothetical protein
MKAYFCSEERFMTVTICYSSQEKKKLLETAVVELVEKYELTPDIFSFADSPSGKGELVIEFEDDYNEEAKPFLEELCKKLDLTFEYSCNPSCDLD